MHMRAMMGDRHREPPSLTLIEQFRNGNIFETPVPKVEAEVSTNTPKL